MPNGFEVYDADGNIVISSESNIAVLGGSVKLDKVKDTFEVPRVEGRTLFWWLRTPEHCNRYKISVSGHLVSYRYIYENITYMYGVQRTAVLYYGYY